jgi:hypothetical protein
MGNGGQTPGQKKGLSNLAWIGIGCGVVLLMVVIAGGAFIWWGVGKAKDMAAEFEANPGLATARLIIKASPELEEVAVDEEAGTITVRNTDTGEEITVDFDEIREGRITFSSDGETVTVEASSDDEGGEVTITADKGSLSYSAGDRVKGERPDWAPLYPGCEPEAEHVLTRDDGLSGAFQLTTTDSVDDVVAHYREQLTEGGFEVGVNTFSGQGQTAAMITGTDREGGRTVVVNTSAEEGKTTIGVTYNLGND